MEYKYQRVRVTKHTRYRVYLITDYRVQHLKSLTLAIQHKHEHDQRSHELCTVSLTEMRI